MRTDALSLIRAHYALETAIGIPAAQLGYLIRSAIVMLCAAWERYNEDLLVEVIGIAENHTSRATNLPDEVKKTISGRIKRDKNDLSPLLLADSGWKSMWLTYATEETEALNTPNRENLNALFKAHFGMEEYSRLWTNDGRTQINKFIGDRGAVAHNGNRARNITMEEMRSYHDMVVSCTIEIDSRMGDELESRYTGARPVWERTYPREEVVPTPATKETNELPPVA